MDLRDTHSHAVGAGVHSFVCPFGQLFGGTNANAQGTADAAWLPWVALLVSALD